MKLLKVVFFVFLFSSCVAQTSQDGIQKHTVAKGETVYQIAKQYQVTPFDIYRLNPDAKEGIQENTTLLIPKKGLNTKQLSQNTDDVKKHIVETKETLYSIAKKYEVSVADLKEWNEADLKDGLKIGQEIIVFVKYAPVNSGYVEVKEIKTTSTVFSHVVKMQETKFGISKKYNISIEELERFNPQIVEGLEVGQVLKIKENDVKETIEVKEIKTTDFYVVKPEETLYSLSKKLNVSEEQLIKLNPEIKMGFKDGMVLKIPVTNVINKQKVDLFATVKKDRKRNLVLLLPFNLNKIESDSIRTQKDYLKDDKFLNLTLDFYSGAMMAIDSAKVLGLPVHVKILDIESSRSTSNVAQVISKNDFSKVDAVIGPFMYSHVETTAQLLSKFKTPVISPLSKEIGLPLDNLYYSIPSQESLTDKMFSYFESKSGNVVAVISGKKTSTKDYLEKKYPNVKYPNYDEKGSLNIESLKALLVKGQKNFIILETEKAALILHTTKALMRYKEEFDLQLVVLELYDTLDFEEIPMTNLTQLNMLFPSFKKEVDADAGRIFEKEFKKKNNVNPNAYATKGFDLTFDTILRICQEDGFVPSTKNSISEQVENTFNYNFKEGKNVNEGIYIMYYDTDYTIKQAK
ncbi:LysM peptidoglycan-binding domain-containing protein [Flavobacterium sp.]|jgi:LysM repeat protein|uniref:LysM peptidoglycan-binding domain-containing protein n=1 Tax=Flavobacterium sp. TaxID=239 RepID=UPI002A83F231|nr:LysM peptidoglycan-binding domain-containing protein [Flavobacterium sp.]